MTYSRSDCARFEASLGDVIDDEIASELREFMHSHVASCENCLQLQRDLQNIRASAAQLQVLLPAVDLWPEIDARIQARVIRLAEPRDATGRVSSGARGKDTPRVHPSAGKRTLSQRVLAGLLLHPSRLAAAAAALVFASAAATYGVIRVTDRSSLTAGAIASDSVVGVAASAAHELLQPQLDTSDPRYAMLTAVARSYSDQIGSLQAVVSARRGLLDSATFRVIERNIGVIDAAIAECMAALAADPSSGFLLDQYRGALDAKVGLLRTAAMLPATEEM